ncbi:hypothetical protein BDF22DRAFT_678529 [Syncephalis plumigaleata]|nr:hypothetical protein BDF22DRAFT_678529 [Syncephalis plumigaleata]
MWRNSLTKGRLLLVQRNHLLARPGTRLIYWRTLSTVVETAKPNSKLVANNPTAEEATSLNVLASAKTINVIDTNTTANSVQSNDEGVTKLEMKEDSDDPTKGQSKPSHDENEQTSKKSTAEAEQNKRTSSKPTAKDAATSSRSDSNNGNNVTAKEVEGKTAEQKEDPNLTTKEAKKLRRRLRREEKRMKLEAEKKLLTEKVRATLLANTKVETTEATTRTQVTTKESKAANELANKDTTNTNEIASKDETSTNTTTVETIDITPASEVATANVNKLTAKDQSSTDTQSIYGKEELPKHFVQLDPSRMSPRTAAFYKLMSSYKIYPSLEALPLTYVISTPRLLQIAMRVWRQFYLYHDGVYPSAVGFDTETTTTIAALRTKLGRKRAIKQLATQGAKEEGTFARKCSLLQIATHECCFLIQLERIKSMVTLNDKPISKHEAFTDLVSILEDANIIKAGVGATPDGETVKRTIDASVASIVDLDRLAAVRGHAAASLSELARIYAHDKEMPLPEYEHYTEMDKYLEEKFTSARMSINKMESVNMELDDMPELLDTSQDNMTLAEESYSKSSTAIDETHEDVSSSEPYPLVYMEPPDGQYASWDWSSTLTPSMIRYATWDAISGLRILEGLLWNKTRDDYQPLFIREPTPFSEIVTSVCHTIYQSIQASSSGLMGREGETPPKGCSGWRLMDTAMTSYGWWVRAYPRERRRIWSEQILRMLLATGTLVPVKRSMLETKKIVKTITLVTTRESENTTTTTEETQTVWTNVPVVQSKLEKTEKVHKKIKKTSNPSIATETIKEDRQDEDDNDDNGGTDTATVSNTDSILVTDINNGTEAAKTAQSMESSSVVAENNEELQYMANSNTDLTESTNATDEPFVETNQNRSNPKYKSISEATIEATSNNSNDDGNPTTIESTTDEKTDTTTNETSSSSPTNENTTHRLRRMFSKIRSVF